MGGAHLTAFLTAAPAKEKLPSFFRVVKAKCKQQCRVDCAEYLRRYGADKRTQAIFRDRRQIIKVNCRGRFQAAL